MDVEIKLLDELVGACGVPGEEGDVRAVIARHLSDITEISYDGLGSIICRRQGGEKTPVITLSGHMDEVGFIVRSISDEGFLRFSALGGWWDHILPGQRVLVKSQHGYIPGVIGVKPPHLLTEDDRKKVMERKDMYIDVGATTRNQVESEFGVRIGDAVVPDSPLRVMKNPDRVMAKAWDDRIGCAIFVEVLKRLQGLKHPNTVYGIGTVQEEVGARGARTSAFATDPGVAFALDVTTAADTPEFTGDQRNALVGKGPCIVVMDGSLVPNRPLRLFVEGVARELRIPFQNTLLERGGTDAGMIHVNRTGVPSLFVAVPARYIHAPVGMVSLSDYRATVDLLTEVITRLDAATVRSFTAWEG